MTKEERVIHYLEIASMPEHLMYDTSDILVQLDLTDEDIKEYQWKLESELSLKPTEKRDVIVKQVIKPLLKEYGFTTSGLDWRRKENDMYLIIHMMNSQWNSISCGASFRFHISAVEKGAIRDKLSNQWVYNQACDLKHLDFLPYCGMLSPLYSGGMYQIDGYKNFLPSDTPVEQISRQIEEDFSKYILPQLAEIKSYEEFQDLRIQKLKRYEDKEIRLIKYYYMAQGCTSILAGDPYQKLVNYRKKNGINREDVMEHLEWLDVCRANAAFTKLDASEIAIRAASDEGTDER